MAKTRTVQSELRRLKRTYKNIPDNKKTLAEGLMEEAARLKVLCDKLWADLEEKGTVELFSQSPETEPYERDRPASRQYVNVNKNYQSCIDKLDRMIPPDLTQKKGSKLDKLAQELERDG